MTERRGKYKRPFLPKICRKCKYPSNINDYEDNSDKQKCIKVNLQDCEQDRVDLIKLFVNVINFLLILK